MATKFARWPRVFGFSCCLAWWSVIAAHAEPIELAPNPDMSEVRVDESVEIPAGWRTHGEILMESDSEEYLTGERSMKVRTPEGRSVGISSSSIRVTPGNEYEVEVTTLARGDNPRRRPFWGLYLLGNDDLRYPEGSNAYLFRSSDIEETEDPDAFVTQSARFVAEPGATWVRVYLIFRADPAGTVHIDSVSIREVWE